MDLEIRKTEKITKMMQSINLDNLNEEKDTITKMMSDINLDKKTFCATKIFIEKSFNKNTPVIISTDKIERQEKLYYSIKQDITGVKILKVNDYNFEKDLKICIKNKDKRFIIFCLDNESEIEKLIINLSSNYTRYTDIKEIRKLFVIHDEANTKSSKWLELNDIYNYSGRRECMHVRLISK